LPLVKISNIHATVSNDVDKIRLSFGTRILSEYALLKFEINDKSSKANGPAVSRGEFESLKDEVEKLKS
jgi:hypothetical protein